MPAMDVRQRIERRLANLSEAQLLEVERAISPFEPPPISLEGLRARREVILGIAARHGASDLRVFGSVARGEAGPGSDVDLLVTLEPGRTLFDLGGLIADLEDLLGRRVDAVTAEWLRSGVSERALAEAKPL